MHIISTSSKLKLLQHDADDELSVEAEDKLASETDSEVFGLEYGEADAEPAASSEGNGTWADW
jgi:hypothetical protein